LKSLLIIGGSGLVGTSLTQLAHNSMKVFFTYNNNPHKTSKAKGFFINLLNNDGSISKLIKSISPDVVVNTAAYQNVDYCEKEQNMANLLHIKSTEEISSACLETSSKLIHFSSNFVFDGKKGFYNEDDLPNPISHYGKTRLDAEKIVLGRSSRNVVLRTTVIYGWHKNSKFTNFVLEQLKNNLKVDAFTDQYGNPTLADDLAHCILKIISRDVSGLFHTVGKNCVNRYEFAKNIAEKFGYNTELISPTLSSEKKQVALRPENGCLNTSKIENELEFYFCDIKTGINQIYEEYVKNNKKLIFK